jgi:hypothetical protein
MSHQLRYEVFAENIPIGQITSVKQKSTFNYFGHVNAPIALEAARFLATKTDACEEEILVTVQTFVQTTQNDCIGNAFEKSACWLTIRVTKPADDFLLPRWHQDGRMFPYDEGREEVVRSKYALTLLGPHTLMLPTTLHNVEVLLAGEKKHYWWWNDPVAPITEEERDQAHDMLRQWLADQFREEERVHIDNGQVVRFSWGRNDSAIHSEPDLVSDRVFMTILYGSEAELHRMCEWRGEEYGRFDW